MSIIPQEVLDKSNKRDYLTAKDFEGEGLEVVIRDDMEIIQARSKEYGANIMDSLYKNGILKEGETIKWKFIIDKEEKDYETKSMAFFIAMKDANPIQNDTLLIKATGEKKNRRYSADIIKPNLEE